MITKTDVASVFDGLVGRVHSMPPERRHHGRLPITRAEFAILTEAWFADVGRHLANDPNYKPPVERPQWGDEGARCLGMELAYVDDADLFRLAEEPK